MLNVVLFVLGAGAVMVTNGFHRVSDWLDAVIGTGWCRFLVNFAITAAPVVTNLVIAEWRKSKATTTVSE